MVKENIKKKFEGFIEELKTFSKQNGQQKKMSQEPVYDIRCLNSQYIFIYSLAESKIKFACGFENFLGYQNQSLKTGSIFYLDLIHPDDVEKVMSLGKSIHHFYTRDDIQPARNIFMVDYRVRKKNGEYARVISHLAPIEHHDGGEITEFISICNNISHIKVNGEISWKMTGPDAELFKHQDELENFLENEIFSKREQEILELLYDGKSSSDIAQTLFISRNTVDTHRRNMLRKANVRSTLELLLFGIENDQIKKKW